jgi:cytochrome c oxidase subunit III
VSLTVAFAALLTGVIVWALLVRRLTAKSWERSVAPEGIEPSGTEGLPPAKIGLWVLLAVVTSLFGLFISAYWMRMGHAHGGGDWTSLTIPRQLWLNTAVLILSSAAMQWARWAASHARADSVRAALIAGGVFAWAFLAGQLLAWRQLSASGYFMTSSPAVAFFYLLTAVHGLHLLGGLFVWGKTVIRMARPGVELVDLRLSVELCTVYWHYLLLVWLVLFGVLLSN